MSGAPSIPQPTTVESIHQNLLLIKRLQLEFDKFRSVRKAELNEAIERFNLLLKKYKHTLPFEAKNDTMLHDENLRAIRAKAKQFEQTRKQRIQLFQEIIADVDNMFDKKTSPVHKKTYIDKINAYIIADKTSELVRDERDKLHDTQCEIMKRVAAAFSINQSSSDWTVYRNFEYFMTNHIHDDKRSKQIRNQIDEIGMQCCRCIRDLMIQKLNQGQLTTNANQVIDCAIDQVIDTVTD